MAISPPELRTEVDRLKADDVPDPVRPGWIDSYEELWREREELRERVERLEAALARAPASAPSRPPWRRRSRLLAAFSHAVFAALCLLAVAAWLAMVAIVGELYEFEDRRPYTPAPAAAPSSSPQAPSASGPVLGAAPELARVERERPAVTSGSSAPVLRLTASRGESWLRVSRGSMTGNVLFEGVLSAGESVTFNGERLALRLGAPDNLEAEVDGEPLRLPPQTADVLVDSGELRVVSLG